MFHYPICGVIIIYLVCCLHVCVSALSFLRFFLTRNANLFVPLLAFAGLKRTFSSFISL